jgi:hypothetical protein
MVSPWPLSSVGSLSYHTYYETGPRNLRPIQKPIPISSPLTPSKGYLVFWPGSQRMWKMTWNPRYMYKTYHTSTTMVSVISSATISARIKGMLLLLVYDIIFCWKTLINYRDGSRIFKKGYWEFLLRNAPSACSFRGTCRHYWHWCQRPSACSGNIPTDEALA